jgi:glycosyltransferase involved in cell wall biosynthesis
LRDGVLALVLPTLLTLIRSPLRFFAAVRLAITTASQSDRPLAYHLFYVAEACRIVPWLAASGARHVHAHFGTNSTDVAMLVRALGGPPYSFTVHGSEEFLRPVGLKEKIRRSEFVVAVSSFGRSQLCVWTRYVDWPKLKIVHCGIDRFFYEGVPTTAASAPRRFVCVGRLVELKGQQLLIEAAAHLAAKGISFDLVLAGDGPTREMLESLITKHALQGRVRITGWISSQQVREEIIASRAMVLPSFTEGLPLGIMEAFALHRPVLATYLAGIPELVRPGENGWLFPAGSVGELAQAIEECLATPDEELRRMGEAGFRRTIARHSIDTEASKLAQLFRESDLRPQHARETATRPGTP